MAAVFLTSVGVAIAGLALSERQYTAGTTIHVATGLSIQDRSVRADDVVYVDRLENTYAQLAKKEELLSKVVRDARLSKRPGIHVKAIPNTELMRIQVTTTQPRSAAVAADRLANLLIAQIRELNAQQVKQADASFAERIGQLARDLARQQAQYAQLLARRDPSSEKQTFRLEQLKASIDLKKTNIAAQQQAYETYRVAQAERSSGLSVVENATPPHSPSSPHVKLDLALAVIVGLVGGVSLAFLAENLSTKLASSEEVTDVVGLSVLGVIPKVKKADEAMVFNHGSPAEEAFRRLAAGIVALQQGTELRTILVTSAQPGEGKSLTTANLGRSIAERNRRVVVVDADLRLPTLHRILGVQNECGLTDVLCDNVYLDNALQAASQHSDRLAVLTSGRHAAAGAVKNPGALLAHADASYLLRQLASRFEFVLVDSPALLAVADALALAPAVDGVLLVMAKDQVARDDLRTAYEQLQSVNARVAGVVVNRADALANHHRYYRAYMSQMERVAST